MKRSAAAAMRTAVSNRGTDSPKKTMWGRSGAPSGAVASSGCSQPLDRHDEVGIALGAQPGQFAVEVRDARRAGPFVEVVHVLRDDLHVVRALQLRDGPVSRVGDAASISRRRML